MRESGINTDLIASRNQNTPIPPWELTKAHFDIDHTLTKKDENPHILATSVRSHLADNYSNHLKVFTDGSVLGNQTGAGYVIPALKVEKSYHIGRNFSIFTAELTAILLALNYLNPFPKTSFKFSFV